MQLNHLFCFGYGFSARTLARRLLAHGGWRVTGTARSTEGLEAIRRDGADAVSFDGSAPLPSPGLAGVTHLLTSVPPDGDGDPVLNACRAQIAEAAGHIAWCGYLSTTGVYGDRNGGWVDETSPLDANTERGRRRVAAEQGWLDLMAETGLPVHLFRLAGIYGPGRNQLESVRAGTAKRIVKPGQVFSRIHVDDIAGVLEASIAGPRPGRAYNVCDDEPAPPQDVIAFAAHLLGVAAPPEVAFEDADLSPMARSFYADSKRVSNARIKEELGYRLVYPDYRAGLRALVQSEN